MFCYFSSGLLLCLFFLFALFIFFFISFSHRKVYQFRKIGNRAKLLKETMTQIVYKLIYFCHSLTQSEVISFFYLLSSLLQKDYVHFIFVVHIVCLYNFKIILGGNMNFISHHSLIPPLDRYIFGYALIQH